MNEKAHKQVIWDTEHAIRMAKAGKCLWCQGDHHPAKCPNQGLPKARKTTADTPTDGRQVPQDPEQQNADGQWRSGSVQRKKRSRRRGRYLTRSERKKGKNARLALGNGTLTVAARLVSVATPSVKEPPALSVIISTAAMNSTTLQQSPTELEVRSTLRTSKVGHVTNRKPQH